MPGLSQLKKFNADILSLGDEVTLRASRGERPVDFPIPKEIEDIDDSEDFVLGMPEIEAEVVDTQVEEDLSDITGLAGGSDSNTDEGDSQPAPSFEAPDLSSLLNPINISDDASAGEEMPDLSMFMEPEEEEVIEEEQEPEEVSVADMGLEALLAGAGFDEPEEEEVIEEEPEPDTFVIPDELRSDFDESAGTASVEDIETLDEPESVSDVETESVPDYMADLEKDLASLDDIPADNSGSTSGDGNFSETGDADLSSIFDDLGIDSDAVNDSSDFGDINLEAPLDFGDSSEDLPVSEEASPADEPFDLDELGDLDELTDIPEVEDIPEADEISDISDVSDVPDIESAESVPEDFDLSGIDESNAINEVETPAETAEEIPDLGDLGDFGSFDTAETANISAEDFGVSDDSTGIEGLDDIGDLGDLGNIDIDVPESDDISGNEEPVEVSDGFDMPEIPETEEAATDEGLSDAGDFGDTVGLDDLGGFGNFDIPETENTSAEDFGTSDESVGLDDFGASEESAGAEDFGISDDSTGIEGLDDIGDFGDLGNIDIDVPESDDISGNEKPVEVSDGFDMPEIPETEEAATDEGLSDMGDFGDTGGLDDFGTSEESVGLDDFGTSEESAGAEDFGIPDDFDMGTPSNLFDSADMEIPDYGEDELDSGSDSEGLSEEDSIEQFDTSAMEGLEFDLPETDSQLEGAASDFDLGNSDDFPMEGSFEIPGFSDVQTAKEEKSTTQLAKKDKGKKSKVQDLDEPDFEGALESEKLPPNTLSDAQYKTFLKNLSEYPLNVRLAFENLIVQDEFTDDAEFEIIEKILEKAPARSVASMLEKMLDISIPVPRDFEHRTAEEYEAYKKSLSYQLRNKIIPGALMGILILLVGWGLYNFGKNCIYIPVKANSLYKQGYVLLEASEYPQSEMKFQEAVKYRLSKKWFFNYARGYRRHKQYQRSELMYTNILRCFDHNKSAGLEYAQMELDDLANYEKAEEIVRREVLDYHINDADGILLLGDVFLEWGTEKDPEKLESAREQYATLIQLYNANDLYLSRMMRYFVRTDNLREVLQLKQAFEPREKSLSADDWTELSGYLLDKSYGPIAPSEEYLRYQIEGLRKLLLRAAHANPANPIALYNLSRYFVQTKETGTLEATLQDCIAKFNALDSIKRRDIYKYIDSYCLLGEYYMDTTDYLQALEQFAEGIHLYTTERDNAGFAGTPRIGKLYENFGDIKYFISGDYDEALENYKNSVELENDSPEMRYRIGYIQYKNKKYQEALGSFMKAGEGHVKERNLLQAMANTLSLRGDDYAAEGYFEQLLNNLDREIQNKGIVLPQTNAGDYDVVNTYLTAANNYGVTLYRLAKRTGNSSLNAQAIVQFSQSVRAWDALTRNQESMVRLGGSNLAEQNIRYITHSMPDFEPSIYIDIKKTLTDNEGLR